MEDNDVDDSCLDKLAELGSLKYVLLKGTKCTEQVGVVVVIIIVIICRLSHHAQCIDRESPC